MPKECLTLKSDLSNHFYNLLLQSFLSLRLYILIIVLTDLIKILFYLFRTLYIF